MKRRLVGMVIFMLILQCWLPIHIIYATESFDWFKLKWVCVDEELSRVEAFKKGFAECLRLYVVVGLLLFVAAIVETVMLLNV